MQTVFLNSICQIGIFMICAQAILHFRPNGSYEKYMKLLVGIMILVQVFLPIARLFSSSSQESFEDRVAWFDKQVEESMSEVSKTAVIADEILGNMTLEALQLHINSKAEEVLEQEDMQDEPPAETQEADNNNNSSVIGIDKVKIEIGEQ